MKHASDILSAAAITLLYTGCLLFYPFSFNVNPDVNFHSLAILLSLGFFIVFLWTYLLSGKTLEVCIIDILLLIAFLGFLSFIIFQHPALNLNNEIFTCYGIMLIAYFVLRLSSPWVTTFYIPLLFIFFFIVEICIGINQYFIFRDSGAELALKIRGTLQNSGVYSIYLVLNLPFCYYLLQLVLKNNKAPLTILIVLSFFITMILYFTKSRTAIVSIFVLAVVTPFFSNYKVFKDFDFSKAKKTIFKVLLIIVFLLIGMFLVTIKSGSAYGRLLIWKVTATHIRKTLFHGLGIGRFSYQYPLWQIQYTDAHSTLPLNYFLNVDESHVAMNEYMEILVENGLLGLVCFLALMICILVNKPLEKTWLLVSSKLTVMGMLVASFFSYVLHCTVLLVLFTFCIAVLCQNLNIRFTKVRKDGMLSVVALLLFYGLLILSFFVCKEHNDNVKKWQELQQDIFAPAKDTQIKYAELYPSLKENGKFLLDYGEHLLDNNQPVTGAVILEESKRYYTSYRTYFSIADAYYQSGNIPLSIKNLKYMASLIPYKFYPKYQLAKLYYRLGDTARGLAMAKLVLNMPVKIPSEEVRKIKEEMQELISTK